MKRATTTHRSEASTPKVPGLVTIPTTGTTRHRTVPPRNCKHKQVISTNVLFFLVLLAMAGIYALVVFTFYKVEVTDNKKADTKNSPTRLEQERGLRGWRGTADPPKMEPKKEPLPKIEERYHDWKDLAVRLAKLPAKEALKELNEKDPFQVRAFEKALLEKETTYGRLLDHSEIEALFSCPASRITLPDQRNLQKARDFRNNKPGTFLFFQHLRKAGGTHFCSLAKANLPKNNVAEYYCMPDMQWSGGKKAGYLHSYTNEEMSQRMLNDHQRIAGNEWDWFDVDHHFDLPAVLATSFRKPLDRALSQFRFECIEDRGCKIKDVHEFWDDRVDLYNVYTQTFADTQHFFGKLKKTYQNEHPAEDVPKRANMMARALDTVAQFNLVLAMEFLAYAGPQVDRVLGFHDTTPLTHRVRPHINQAQREDGQEQNKLGAAGITKASWDPEKYLDKDQYQKMSEHLTLDMILTDAARRMFLERLVCKDLDE